LESEEAKPPKKKTTRKKEKDEKTQQPEFEKEYDEETKGKKRKLENDMVVDMHESHLQGMAAEIFEESDDKVVDRSAQNVVDEHKFQNCAENVVDEHESHWQGMIAEASDDKVDRSAQCGMDVETFLENCAEKCSNEKDKASFLPEKWLSDAAVHFACLYQSLVESPNQDVFFARRMYQSFKNSSEGTERTRLIEKWKKSSASCSVVVFPMNINGSHWVCVAHVVSRNTLVILDPLRAGALQSLRIIRGDKTLKSMLNLIGEKESSRMYKMGHCPEQNDGFDCGMHLISNMKYISINSRLFCQQLRTEYEMECRNKYLDLFVRCMPTNTNVKLVGSKNLVILDDSCVDVQGNGNVLSGCNNRIEVSRSSVEINGSNNVIVKKRMRQIDPR
jgi:Ulp1 family protease